MKRAWSLAWVVVCLLSLAAGAAFAQQEEWMALDEQWARIADEVPGFAGYVLDERGVARVRLVEDARKAGEPRDRAVVEFLERAFGADYRVEPAQFNFRELYNWKLALNAVVANPENRVWFVDIDEEKNRIVLGIDQGVGKARLTRMEKALSRLDVPREAVILEPVETPVNQVLLGDRVDPTPGGVEIGIGGGLCTVGVNAKRGADTGHFTAAHCSDVAGSSVTQPGSGPRVGAVNAYGSAIAAGCPAGETCKRADALFVKYDTLAYARMCRIARTAGANQFTITSYSLIKNVLSNPSSGTIRKVGRTTAETTTSVKRSCVNAKFGGDRFYYLCLNTVDGRNGAFSAPGDSGAPLFTDIGGGEVTLHGLLKGGSSTEIWYSPWQNVVGDFGTLTLCP